MKTIGPIIDGQVEFPLGSGVFVPADGMLSRHSQCDRIRAVFRKVTGRDSPDMPVVIDRWCPRKQIVVCENVAIVNRPGEEIERVLIVDQQTADAIADGFVYMRKE